jgi:hypothetical protein
MQSSSPAGEGYTPVQMQQAYGFNQITLPAGQTFDVGRSAAARGFAKSRDHDFLPKWCVPKEHSGRDVICESDFTG